MEQKTCSVCQKTLTLDYFHNAKQGKYGKMSKCKACSKEKGRLWALANPEKHRKIKKREYEKNKSRISKANKAWREANPTYESDRYENDIEFKLKKRLRIRLNSALRRNLKTGSAISELGCSVEDFKQRIESLWKPGMTWENYGHRGNCWNLDHIRPLSSFDLQNRDEFLKACHYTNIQPLWASENYSKGDKWSEEKASA